MQKKHVIAATAALIAVVGLATASLTGFFDAGTNVDFIAKTSGPQLLLPSADKKELRRLRTNNPDGSANDIVELANGYTQEVHFWDVRENRRTYERTFYPAAKGQTRGSLYSERIFAESGLGIKSERYLSPEGKLTKEGQLYQNNLEKDKSWQYNLALYSPLGKVSELQVRNLKGQLIGKTLNRPDGTADVSFKYPSPDTETYFDARHFAEDGTTVNWQESRSFGNYSVTYNYPGTDKPRETSSVSPRSANLITYRLDGTKLSEFREYRDYGRTFIDYDNSGEVAVERFFGPQSGKVDASGQPVFSLRRIEIKNGKDNVVAHYEWFDNGKLEVVQFHKNATRKLRVDYRYDKVTGKLKQRIEFGDDDKVSKIINDPKDTPVLDIKAAWFDAPARPAVAASRVNVDGEEYRGGHF
ncbi:MAG: hypothetical protein IPI39_25740 [Candidatus Obscuribacter sp.]|nr:hypothetical protein [Candidatus Obscuribacter sp.]MBK9620718.1 hypothetical protein [Candidatus Obscuribacter sp.]